MQHNDRLISRSKMFVTLKDWNEKPEARSFSITIPENPDSFTVLGNLLQVIALQTHCLAAS